MPNFACHFCFILQKIALRSPHAIFVRCCPSTLQKNMIQSRQINIHRIFEHIRQFQFGGKTPLCFLAKMVIICNAGFGYRSKNTQPGAADKK